MPCSHQDSVKPIIELTVHSSSVTVLPSVKERAMLPSAISMTGRITSYQNTQRWKGSSLYPADYVHLLMPVSMIEVAKEIIDASASA